MIFLFGKKKQQQVTPISPPKFEGEKLTIGKLSLPVASKGEGHTAEDIRLIIKEWLDLIHIKMKTRLNKRQVRAITIFQGVANEWEVTVMDDFLIEYRINKLSEDGQSSKELVEILKARMPELQEDNAMNKLSRFLE